MKYRSCERCGASLDFGEKCDCMEEERIRERKIENYIRTTFVEDDNFQMSFAVCK